MPHVPCFAIQRKLCQARGSSFSHTELTYWAPAPTHPPTHPHPPTPHTPHHPTPPPTHPTHLCLLHTDAVMLQATAPAPHAATHRYHHSQSRAAVSHHPLPALPRSSASHRRVRRGPPWHGPGVWLHLRLGRQAQGALSGSSAAASTSQVTTRAHTREEGAWRDTACIAHCVHRLLVLTRDILWRALHVACINITSSNTSSTSHPDRWY
jgi:hypothetical protein